MSEPQLALRYSRALFDLAIQRGILDTVRADMAAIDRIMAEVPEIRAYCLSRTGNKEKAGQLVESAFCPHVGDLTANTLRQMVKNGRLRVLPFFVAAFKAAEEAGSRRVEVILESTQPANPDLVALVTSAMKDRAGPEIDLVQKVRPELKGGFRILWQNKLIDYSARGRLRALRKLLKTS